MSANINDLMAARFGSGNSNDAFYQWLARSATIPALALVVGNYYGFRSSFLGAGTTLTLTAGRLEAVPFFLSADSTVDRLALNVATAGAASSTMRLGIYTSGSDLLPAALLVDSGELATDSVGVKEATISQALEGGRLYYLALNASAAPVVTATLPAGALLGGATAAEATQRASFYRALAYGALPATWGTPSSYSGSPPHIVVRAG